MLVPAGQGGGGWDGTGGYSGPVVLGSAQIPDDRQEVQWGIYGLKDEVNDGKKEEIHSKWHNRSRQTLKKDPRTIKCYAALILRTSHCLFGITRTSDSWYKRLPFFASSIFCQRVPVAEVYICSGVHSPPLTPGLARDYISHEPLFKVVNGIV